MKPKLNNRNLHKISFIVDIFVQYVEGASTVCLLCLLKVTCIYYEAFHIINKTACMSLHSFIDQLGDYIRALCVLTLQVQLNQLPYKASPLRVLFPGWLID